MEKRLTTARRWLAVGWFWPLVLLALPNCSFQAGAESTSSAPNLDPGPGAHTSAVFCDIEKPLERHCASDDEIAQGIRIASAAIALNTGSTGQLAIDDSPAALQRCGGKPEAVTMYGAFPEGFTICLDCGGATVRGNPPANNNELCAAQCEDFFGQTGSDGTLVPDNPPDPSVVDFCTAHAHVSTNFPLNGCFDNACLAPGMSNPAFFDPRRNPEPVVWQNLVGVSASGSTLTKTATTADFDSGASSTQTIANGDGYVEFTVAETNTARIAGLSTGAADTDAHANSINFGVGLSFTGQIFVFENGNQIGPFGTYAAGDRFRVNVRDRFDGTATVTYSRVTGTCTPGSPCNDQAFFTSTTSGAYPFRVDSSLFNQNATLANVQLVRIH
ncbi:MAG TPA: hypothetical protein VFA27_05145 [Vicinamibacterales bacterium]|nr:hypothetical protein [Vicinamibacterales bacterium]